MPQIKRQPTCVCGHVQDKHYKLIGVCDAQDVFTGASCACPRFRQSIQSLKEQENQHGNQQNSKENNA